MHIYFSLFLAFRCQICYNISVETVQNFRRNIFCIMLAVAVTLVATLLIGCSDNVDMTLLRSDISLLVGESRDILPYVEFSAVGDNAIELNTDSDCLEIDGTVVTATKTGTAEVNVSSRGKTVVMNITVSYRSAQDFVLTTENAVQTVGDGDKILPVVLAVEFDSYVTEQTVAQWDVGDTSYEGNRFEYTPKGYGEYAVSVTVGDLQKQCAVKVYRRTDVTVKHSDINNAKAFAPVTFTAYEDVNTLNPVSVYEWRVNGEAKSDRPLFEFTPTDGEYGVSLYVNGERKKIDGKEELVFAVADGATDFQVVYDDVGGVYVRWAKQRKVLYVSVVSPTGERRIFDVTDAQYAHLFGDGSFRATEYIDICAENPAAYTVIIGTDGERYELNFSQLPADAKSYLEEKVMIKNAFISSEEDAREFVRELYALGKTTAKCYVVTGMERVENAAREQAEMLGLSTTTVTDGNILSFTFAQYANKPTKYESKPSNKYGPSDVMNNMQLPLHIAYSERRPNDFVFMSDRFANSMEVRGSEQLLLAVSNGVKPITHSDDVANSIYRVAKYVLLRIIGTDYTTRQKIHAIYDWLQWVTVNVQDVHPSSASRFLESVFVSSRDNGYVVTSEGAAKAFALLCGMEGIECVTARDASYGYYNRVKMNDMWYNVDVFGGKITVTGALLPASSTDIELTSHRGLLISDEQLEALGCSETDGLAFDSTNSEFVNKHTAYGTYFDYYITESELTYETVRAAVFFALDRTVVGMIPIALPNVGSEVSKYNNTYCLELALDRSLTDEQTIAVTVFINRAIDEYAKDVLNNSKFVGGRIVRAGNIIVAIAGSPRAEV